MRAAQLGSAQSCQCHPGGPQSRATTMELHIHRRRRELGVLLDELEAQLGLLAHQALTRFSVLLRSSSAISTRTSVRWPGRIVVSLSCAGIISPRPLKRDTSTFALGLNALFVSRARSASSRA